MSPPFLVALLLVVAVLGAVVWSGVSRRRRLHYGLVVTLFVALGWAIREAEVMGRGLVFDGLAGTLHQAHMVAIGITFLIVLPLVASGVRLAKSEQVALRVRHRQLAVAFVGAVVVTCALGTAMTLLARPAPADGTGAPVVPDLG